MKICSMKTCSIKMRAWMQQLSNDSGSQLVELALVLPVMMLVLAGAVDFGRAYFVKMEVASAAEAGATYGVQNPSDTTGMKAAASLDAPDLTNLSSTATHGTECSDGTSAVTSTNTALNCSVNPVQFVEVDATATYSPILPYPGFPSQFTFTSRSRMRASQ